MDNSKLYSYDGQKPKTRNIFRNRASKKSWTLEDDFRQIPKHSKSKNVALSVEDERESDHSPVTIFKLYKIALKNQKEARQSKSRNQDLEYFDLK